MDQIDKYQKIGHLIMTGGGQAAAALRISCSIRTINCLPVGSRKHELLLWLTRLTDDYADRFLSFDQKSAIAWGALCAELEASGHPIPVLDGLIAACALRHGLTLVTRNEKEYRHSAVPLLNPWGGSPYAFPECGRRLGLLAARAVPSIVD
ncbi:MAG: hypothetical protein A2087_06080 [Spirochaetes bacterium GWD1_61_31]|nr:MAG: hypothetical protein A2Y37_13155 [Spirochaetes bacterium GWB1_60_80]OHD30362.1 MAG: hypothetical protein A2004_08415 [Spirochaetes bacterium GWC1_61_12]OHD42501.1 MAG: hypothetical protein A2Y35_07950 [Spirochaetes bacterium GWE1_60_18]OHD43176.1 MAG: hypothetical protein A2087_06080 [Spirochaetes bacterium GWD1_61_31]OHD58229.1 MAG: hypothetical protein A2Y32_04870 [Spirochaetes bacterium GWF1_60_12]HAP42492.1 VapC toxin family PIN domain ribonuclease [Spirochaetaceae bacterium]